MKVRIPTQFSRTGARTALVLSKNSPTILFGAGVVGFGATVLLACKATLKVEEVLEEHEKKMIDVNTVQHVEYSERDRKQDKVVLYTQTTVKIIRLYSPAIVVGTLSVAALTGSHRILSSRNAALTAAYAAIEKGFNDYRKRVVAELGEEKDKEFRYGTTEVREVVQGKNGPETRTVKKIDPQASIYARFFDKDNPNWTQPQEYNRIFLNGVQSYANDRLRSRGHVFLNEVYDDLGLERSSAGAVVGWVLNSNGDNRIDFGAWTPPQTQSFINGEEGAILLDFNVDGVIYDLIDKKRDER